jgi:hypothetical protein
MAYFVVQGHELNPFTGRPDNSLPGPGYGGRPDNSLPWGPGRPDGGLPWAPGHPSGGFPVAPALPGQDLPWAPARPDNTLPGQPGYPSGQPVTPGATPYGTAVATPPPEKVDPSKGGWLLVSVPGHGLIWAWGQPPAAPPATKPPVTPPAQPKV